MQHIDRNKLYADGDYRFEYVSGFMEFGAEDIAAIEAVAPLLRPIVPAVVDAVYVKLFSYDITKIHFLPRNEGFQGEVPKNLEELTLESEQIKFRKDFLKRYLDKLLSGPYDGRMIRYLDWVAKIHTDTPEKKSKINVEYIHMNALMGYVESTLVGGVLSLKLPEEQQAKTLAAFNKLLWIQNDFFAKYYCTPEPVHTKSSAPAKSLADSINWTTAIGAVIGGLAVWFYKKQQSL
ncbi:Protoglobin-domain-containing protein [Dichotomocladium elegans]|nr:Protoglobin-domain-containing protein [Dichotomocladium elegans]